MCGRSNFRCRCGALTECHFDGVFAIRDGLVDKYVPECERGCSLLTRRGLSQVSLFNLCMGNGTIRLTMCFVYRWTAMTRTEPRVGERLDT